MDEGRAAHDSAERYRRVAAQLTDRVRAVPVGAWDQPSPCEGWVARDVVRHLVEWLPDFFFGRWDLERPVVPSADDDPVGAWAAVDRALQAALDDPAVALAERDTPMGRASFAGTVDQICTPDLLIHTWDLARATGLDETLDPVEVHALLGGMEGLGDVLEQSGHYGPRVPVPDDADEQTRLLALTGRRP